MGDNKKRSKTGIYKITNTVNGKYYIGSAIRISGRFGTHRSQLRKNIHHSIILQRAWNKYGEKNFDFSILEECEKSKLIEREQWYIDNYKPIYNISPTAGNCLGVKGTIESNSKKSLNHSKLGKFGKDHNSSIPIYQYDLSGKFLKMWYGAKEIERELGFDSGNIASGIKYNKTRTPYGYFWSKIYLGECIEPKQQRNRSNTCKKIGMYNIDDTLLKEFKSQEEAKQFFNKKSNSTINNALKNKTVAYGYKWKYIK